jgi:hypothetical protein
MGSYIVPDACFGAGHPDNAVNLLIRGAGVPAGEGLEPGYSRGNSHAHLAVGVVSLQAHHFLPRFARVTHFAHPPDLKSSRSHHSAVG